jgi:hypothetical protein
LLKIRASTPTANSAEHRNPAVNLPDYQVAIGGCRDHGSVVGAKTDVRDVNPEARLGAKSFAQGTVSAHSAGNNDILCLEGFSSSNGLLVERIDYACWKLAATSSTGSFLPALL